MCKRSEIENLFKPRIHREGGRYWADVPAMPGCFTVADTLDELRGNIIEAMQCWLLTSADMANYRQNKAADLELLTHTPSITQAFRVTGVKRNQLLEFEVQERHHQRHDTLGVDSGGDNQ